MSATSPVQTKSILDGLSITNAVLALVISVAVAGATYGGLTSRLSGVESKAEEVKQNMVSKDRYEADMRAVERIERTVQEIRHDQIEDLRRRANKAGK